MCKLVVEEKNRDTPTPVTQRGYTLSAFNTFYFKLV